MKFMIKYPKNTKEIIVSQVHESDTLNASHDLSHASHDLSHASQDLPGPFSKSSIWTCFLLRPKLFPLSNSCPLSSLSSPIPIPLLVPLPTSVPPDNCLSKSSSV